MKRTVSSWDRGWSGLVRILEMRLARWTCWLVRYRSGYKTITDQTFHSNMAGFGLRITSSKGHTVSTGKMSFSCLYYITEYSKVYVCDYKSINIYFEHYLFWQFWETSCGLTVYFMSRWYPDLKITFKWVILSGWKNTLGTYRMHAGKKNAVPKMSCESFFSHFRDRTDGTCSNTLK